MAKTKVDATKLWLKYKRSGDLDARNQLVEEYLPLVRYVAERLQTRLPQSVELDDLQSSGLFGLFDAIEKFDLERGVKFETYCTNRIRGAILDELRSLDWVPRLVRARVHKLERAYQSLEARFQRAPTDAEMARELELNLDDFDSLVKEVSAAAVLPTGKRWLQKEENPALENVDVAEAKGDTDPSLEIQKKELVEYVTKNCTKKERLILLLYYYEEMTMKEIGQTLDLSESRVCQIHSKLIARLKAKLRSLNPAELM